MVGWLVDCLAGPYAASQNDVNSFTPLTFLFQIELKSLKRHQLIDLLIENH